MLQAVFSAIHDRSTANGSANTTVTNLTIENLQNQALPEDILSSEAFKSTLKNITNLRLQIAHERTGDDGDPVYELDYLERQTFEPWLQTTLLPMFGSNLTTLHLAFNDYWGVCPGYFDGQNLFFPNLKTLTLRAFTIAHHDQFNWVLRQTALQTLRLDQCVIMSHITIEGNQLETWKTPTHDWDPCPILMPDPDPDPDTGVRTFNFPGTWETVFQNIQTELVNLVDFRTEHPTDPNGKGPFYFFMPERLRCVLSHQRYITTWCPRVYETPEETELGANRSTSLPRERRSSKTWANKPDLNRAKETRDGDWEALNALVDVVVERRPQHGLC